jgi:stage II sporulation protein D
LLRAYYSSTSGGRAASARDTWPTVAGFEFNLQGPLQAQSRPELGRSSPWYRWTVNRTRQELADRLREWGRVNGHAVRGLTALTSARVSGVNGVGRPSRFEVHGGGRSYELSAEELRRACNQAVEGHPPVVRANRVNSGDMEWSIIGDVVTIRGRGFGHGVGLCQYSAKELADRGAGSTAILMQFYPGARVERAY